MGESNKIVKFFDKVFFFRIVAILKLNVMLFLNEK